MAGKLFTMGYTEDDALVRLDAFMERPEAGLVDIRLRPVSRWRPEFRQAALIARYGATRYQHCRGLGNVNYALKGTAPIVLADPDREVRAVCNLLAQGSDIMLLCACKHYERCHRKTVYELIIAALDKAE